METLFVPQMAKFRQRNDTISVTLNGRTRSLPINRVAHLVLLAEGQLSTKLLELCGKHGVRLSVFDYYGYFKGSFEPIAQSPSGQVKLEQAKLLLDEGHRLALAREILRGAFHNMGANLQYYAYRDRPALLSVVQELRHLALKLDKGKSTPEIMGYEGNAHQLYYAAWKEIDPDLDFGKRVRRPPNNPVNCLISFLNQMTYTVVRHELAKTHLEETFSFLHSPGAGRASLSLDLAEIFKPLLSDALIFRMIRKKMADPGWFEQQEGICLLTETGRRNVAEQFSLRLEERVQDRSYREWIYRQALAIERHALGVAEFEVFKRKA